MRRSGFVFFLLISLLIVALPAGSGTAQTTGERYFPETGHWVRDEFLAFYSSIENPLEIYGLPITDEFIDPIFGVRMQYFQKARFEISDQAGDQPRVILSPLGKYLFNPAIISPVTINVSTAPCKTFPSQLGGYRVCYGFLDFFEANGGIQQFGQPVSNLVREGERYLQYFENAKFEWRPESLTGDYVVLTDLGRLHFDQSHRDPRLLFFDVSNAQMGDVLELSLNAFVDLAVVKVGDVQTLTVLVHDQHFQPVPGANVSIVVYRDYAEDLRANLPPTGENGVTKLSFDVGSYEPESLVPIDIKVTYQGVTATTQTWFRVWW